MERKKIRSKKGYFFEYNKFGIIWIEDGVEKVFRAVTNYVNDIVEIAALPNGCVFSCSC